MSRSYPGEQVEHAFISHRLCNWETPKKEEKVSATHRFDTLRPRNGRTQFIVDERGHLVKGGAGSMKLDGTSFNQQPEIYDMTIPRWPQTSNPAIPHYASATMGYKGIKTNYLPCNTVTLKAVDQPLQTRLDGRVAGRYTGEYNYNFM